MKHCAFAQYEANSLCEFMKRSAFFVFNVPKARFIAAGDFILHAPQVRFIPPNKKPPDGGGFLFGGGRWIRTTEVSDNRFTVCPLWPLGNSPWSW